MAGVQQSIIVEAKQPYMQAFYRVDTSRTQIRSITPPYHWSPLILQSYSGDTSQETNARPRTIVTETDTADQQTTPGASEHADQYQVERDRQADKWCDIQEEADRQWREWKRQQTDHLLEAHEWASNVYSMTELTFQIVYLCG